MQRGALLCSSLCLAEDMGLEPTRLLHPTRFPGELLSHSVNPPSRSNTITNSQRSFKGYSDYRVDYFSDFCKCKQKHRRPIVFLAMVCGAFVNLKCGLEVQSYAVTALVSACPLPFSPSSSSSSSSFFLDAMATISSTKSMKIIAIVHLS